MTEQTEISEDDLDRIRVRLEKNNMSLAIDDYGTGYSNTSNLLPLGKEDLHMNKTELIAEVAKKCGMSKKDAEKAVTTTFDTITEALSQGDKVQLVGFGGFETKKREARMGRNPKTKEAIEIPATTIPVFKAGKALKEKTAK